MTSSEPANGHDGRDGLDDLDALRPKVEPLSPPSASADDAAQALQQGAGATAPGAEATGGAEAPHVDPLPGVYDEKSDTRMASESGREEPQPLSPQTDSLPVKPEPPDQTAAMMADDRRPPLFPPPAYGLFTPEGLDPGVMAIMNFTGQASQGHVPPRTTVSLADMNLQDPSNQSADPLALGNRHTGGASSMPAAGPGLESFARIEFADSVFQMTTYAVIIGRDQRALNQARSDEKRKQEWQRLVDENERNGLPPPKPPSQNQGKFSKSYVSEEGGMLGPESDGDDKPRPSKRRKTSATGSVALPHQRNDEAPDEPAAAAAAETKANLIMNRQYVSHTPGAAMVDLAVHRPSLHHIPFIGIHSPGPDIASKTKAISREHIKVEFNRESGVFEAIPLHRNGFFRDDEHHSEGRVVLRSGDRLQVKDVEFTFIIPGLDHGQTGAEDYLDEEEEASSGRRYSEGGKEMSFEFESSHADEAIDTSEEDQLDPVAAEQSAEEESAQDDEDEDGEDVRQTVESDELEEEPEPEPEPEPELPPPPKKRGPGRPPKNGIMSKREERLRKKQALEAAKRAQPQPPPGEPPVKRKVGRPRKHPLPEEGGEKPEKRKYKPRKPKNPEDGGSDPEKQVKEKRREKPKTPPLELNMADFTPEQLEKPNKNYGVLIDEVLRDAPQGLSLKQIYKRIQQKYPFYYFSVETKGWESSVRHNLIGNDAFKKNDETHLWSRVPGVELDAGRKRKAASPDRSHLGQQWSQQAPRPQYPGQALAGTIPAQGFGAHANPAFHGLPNPSSFASPGDQPPTRPSYLQAQGAGPAQAGPGYGPPGGATRPLQPGAPPVSYHSPYTTKPHGAAGSLANGNPADAAAQRPSQPPLPIPRQGVGSGGQHGHLQTPGGTTGPRLGAGLQATNGSGLSLKPVVDPAIANFIRTFKNQVINQLEKRFPNGEAIAMSVVNRAIGLATTSTVPDHESIEKIIFDVFVQAKSKYPDSRVLEPKLVEVLTAFKTQWVTTLKGNLGQEKSEALLLSVLDRGLGFTEVSIMHPGSAAEKKEFEDAENLLVPLVKRHIEEYQRAISATK